MAVDLEQSDRLFKRIAQVVESGVDDLARDMGRRIFLGLVEDTIRVTGAAQSNWLVGTNASRRTPVSPSSPLTTIANGVLAINRVDVANGEAIVIYNNDPAIPALNDGSSDRVPIGFVQQNIRGGKIGAVRAFAGMIEREACKVG